MERQWTVYYHKDRVSCIWQVMAETAENASEMFENKFSDQKGIWFNRIELGWSKMPQP